MFVVVSYDIPDDRRRLKIAQTLLDYGGERVQYSVFEMHITARHFERLRRELDAIIDPGEDSVRFYRLCGACQGTVLYLGVARPIDGPGLLII